MLHRSIVSLVVVLLGASLLAGLAASRPAEETPVLVNGYPPGWLYPGRKAVFQMYASLINSQASTVPQATVVLSHQSKFLALLKQGTRTFAMVDGKPTWSLTNVTYVQYVHQGKRLPLTFYVKPRAKPGSKLCIAFTVVIGESVSVQSPVCTLVKRFRR